MDPELMMEAIARSNFFSVFLGGLLPPSISPPDLFFLRRIRPLNGKIWEVFMMDGGAVRKIWVIEGR